MLNLSCKKTYDGKVVLDVGGLIFEKGKRYAVIGSNGSYTSPAPTFPALNAGIRACITKTDATISFGIWACGN